MDLGLKYKPFGQKSWFYYQKLRIAYNHPYYKDLFESYGFMTYYKQEGFHLDVKKGIAATVYENSRMDC